MKLYITVETTSRELEAKTLLACCAAAAGFDVVIGLEDMVRRLAKFSAPGIFYDKSLHSEYPALFRELKQLGHQVAVNDEEGVIVNEQWYRDFGVNPGIRGSVDTVFLWGERQRELIRQALPDFPGQLVTSGNPRIDMLRPRLRPFHQDAVNAIRARYGHFILINTRFSFANNVGGRDAFQQRIERGEIGKDIAHLLGLLDYDQQLFDHFVRMTRDLAARFPDRSFVLRPHPSENIDVWKERTVNLANVHVVREGNVHQWILASDMLLHNGCSTAVEAFFLDAPCLSYQPICSDEFDVVIPNAVSYPVKSMPELIRCIEAMNRKDVLAGDDTRRAYLTQYIHTESELLASEIIVTELRRMAAAPAPSLSLQGRLFRLGNYLRHVARTWKANCRGPKKRGRHSKWVPLSLVEFRSLVDSFAFYDETFTRLDVQNAYFDCFRLKLQDRL